MNEECVENEDEFEGLRTVKFDAMREHREQVRKILCEDKQGKQIKNMTSDSINIHKQRGRSPY